MKKAILLLVATAACVIFTACPNKPEAVVIPDGLYEETAHFVRYEVLFRGFDRIETLNIDTVYATQVLIDQGEFIYQDMCADTFHMTNPKGDVFVRYHSHFIYGAYAYCPDIVYSNGEMQVNSTVKNPALMSSDGFVIIPSPQFSDLIWTSIRDSNYVYRTPVSKKDDAFYFEQDHEFKLNDNVSYKYHITHTLRRL